MKSVSPSSRPLTQFYPENPLPDFASPRQETQLPPLEQNGRPTWNVVASLLNSLNTSVTQLNHSKEESSEHFQIDTEPQTSQTLGAPRREKSVDSLEYSPSGLSHYTPDEFPQQFHSSPLSSPQAQHHQESSDCEQSGRLKRQRSFTHSSLSSLEDRTTRISQIYKPTIKADDPLDTESEDINAIVTSSPQVAINNIDLERLIFDGTNELFLRNSRNLLFSALHGMMGYIHPWNRPPAKHKSWPTKRDVLLINGHLLRDNCIDVFDKYNLELLLADSGGPLNGEFVFLVAARLAIMERRIKVARARALHRAVFEFVTGHRGYRGAIESVDRRIIYDDGRVKFDAHEGFF